MLFNQCNTVERRSARTSLQLFNVDFTPGLCVLCQMRSERGHSSRGSLEMAQEETTLQGKRKKRGGGGAAKTLPYAFTSPNLLPTCYKMILHTQPYQMCVVDCVHYFPVYKMVCTSTATCFHMCTIILSPSHMPFTLFYFFYKKLQVMSFSWLVIICN